MRKLFGIVGWLLFACSAASAQADYPARPVTLVVPYAAGGPSDVSARILADELGKIWKQQVVILNKPGGGTIIGTDFAARAVPDGYTWIFAGGSYVVNPAVRKTMPYDTLKDLKGIIVFDDSPIDIVAHNGFAANTLAELIETAKQRTLTFASAGVGSVAHMTGELLAQVAGIKLKHIAYPGDAAALADVMSGRVDFRIGTWSDDRPHVEGGKLKVLGVVYPKRLPEIANIPTVSEVLPEMAKYPAGGFNAIAVPAGVPPAIVEKISQAMKLAVSSDTFKEKITALGLYPRFTTPAEADAFFRDQIGAWSHTGKAAGISID